MHNFCFFISKANAILMQEMRHFIIIKAYVRIIHKTTHITKLPHSMHLVLSSTKLSHVCHEVIHVLLIKAHINMFDMF